MGTGSADEMDGTKLRVFILEDHEAVRRGLREILQEDGNIEVIGEAAEASGAAKTIASLQPDVALLDISLPDGSGVDVCSELRRQEPNVPCLMLTVVDDEEVVVRAVMAGAAGYVLKSAKADLIREAARRVAAGESLLHSTVVQGLYERAKREPQNWASALSDEEKQIIVFSQQGLSNAQIAEKLSLPEREVDLAISQIFSKINTTA